MLTLAAQQVQLVIAENRQRAASLDQLAHESYRTGAVWSAVDEITDEDEGATCWVASRIVIAGRGKQGLQRIELAMDIADDVQGCVR